MKATLDDLEQLLASDATFVAALQALNLGSLGAAATPKVMRGNKPLASLGQEHFPCWVLELGDVLGAPVAEGGAGAGLVIGSTQQSFQAEILLALVWHQKDNDTAVDQRAQLLAPLTRLLLDNLLDGTVNAWVAGMNNDRQANHPTQIAGFTLGVTATVSS